MVRPSSKYLLSQCFSKLLVGESGHENAKMPQEVGGPIFFFTLIFVIAFLPLFTMRGVEGAIFSPMSRTYTYALGAAILLSLTLTPVLASARFRQGLPRVCQPGVECDQPLLSL